MPLKKYKSHKTVKADKIGAINLIGNNRARLTFEGGEQLETNPDWVLRLPKGKSEDLGYFVQYEDGHQSWSPSDAFEDGYTEIIDGTSDDRTHNNVVRHEYRTLTEGEKAQMLQFKDMGAAFISLCDEIGVSRELSLAKTKMQEAVMWAVNHVTR